MLVQLGFGYLSAEILWTVALCLCVLSVVVAFVVDYVWGDFSFGLFGNAFLSLIGSTLGLLAYGNYALPHVKLEPVGASLACVAGSFLFILFIALLRRLAR